MRLDWKNQKLLQFVFLTVPQIFVLLASYHTGGLGGPPPAP